MRVSPPKNGFDARKKNKTPIPIIPNFFLPRFCSFVLIFLPYVKHQLGSGSINAMVPGRKPSIHSPNSRHGKAKHKRLTYLLIYVHIYIIYYMLYIIYYIIYYILYIIYIYYIIYYILYIICTCNVSHMFFKQI